MTDRPGGQRLEGLHGPARVPAGRRLGCRRCAGGLGRRGGAARLLAGLVQVVEPASITAVVNTGDDIVLHGLHISPDIDTVTYTLAGLNNEETGWGLAGETWTVMEALEPSSAARTGSASVTATWPPTSTAPSACARGRPWAR